MGVLVHGYVLLGSSQGTPVARAGAIANVLWRTKAVRAGQTSILEALRASPPCVHRQQQQCQHLLGVKGLVAVRDLDAVRLPHAALAPVPVLDSREALHAGPVGAHVRGKSGLVVGCRALQELGGPHIQESLTASAGKPVTSLSSDKGPFTRTEAAQAHQICMQVSIGREKRQRQELTEGRRRCHRSLGSGTGS